MFLQSTRRFISYESTTCERLRFTPVHVMAMIPLMVRPNLRAWWPDFLLLAAVWGASFLFMRMAVVDFGAIPTALLRAAIGALALLPLLFWSGGGAALLPHWRPV